jgi:pyruvate/2-oxoglutarate dehydrogenase complex dihydrolipoamide acyltransferase (E2) component
MDVVMPQLGETVAEGKVSAWFKAPGDAVAAGDNLFEIETDKVTMDVQALASGVLSEIRVPQGGTVPVGAVVAVIGDAGAVSLSSPVARSAEPGEGGDAALGMGNPHPLAGASRPPPSREKRGVGSGNGAAAPFKLAPFAETNTPTGRFGRAEGPFGLKVTPLARRLIAQNGMELRGLAQDAKAKGAWRIGKAEVEAALASKAQASTGQSARPSPLPSPPTQGEGAQAVAGAVAPFNRIRRQTGERLQQAWQTVPHVFQAVEVDFAAADRVRLARREAFKARHGVALTYLPFIARAVCIALADFPRVNARLEGDGLAVLPNVHLGIAVDLSHEGLVVPVVRDAGELTLAGLAKAMARQVDKARAGKLLPDDLSGATYTISNNGAFGTLFTAPIVNPPQVAILSTDAVRKKPVVVESADGDAIAIHPVGVVAQSFDHRAFDGAYSAAFLARVAKVIETRDWAGELA